MENFLQEHFEGLDEVGGMAITKDNFEDMYESWLEGLDTQELIYLADEAIVHYKNELLQELRNN